VRAWITPEPIDPVDVLDAVGSDADGAAVLFLGTVRNENDGRTVSGLRYEAYLEMAENVLAEIAAEAESRWSTDRIAAVHRVGELAIGDVSVAVAVSTAHRAEAFDAARYVIEQLKVRLPVWKHEHYVTGETAWVGSEIPASSMDV
jgi:molybdopterin synthase catalytic subunit